MRHNVAGRRLGRSSAHRKALYRNLVTDLLNYEKITTTEAKAKEVRGLAEKMITLGKDGKLAARRQALAFILDEKVGFHHAGAEVRRAPGWLYPHHQDWPPLGRRGTDGATGAGRIGRFMWLRPPRYY